MSDDARTLLELQQEQWRRQCRRSFISFTIEACPLAVSPPHCTSVTCSKLEAVACGKAKKLDHRLLLSWQRRK